MFIGLSHEKMIEKSQPFEEKLFISKAIQKSTVQDVVKTGGPDGKPMFISGPRDDTGRIMRILNNSVGEGNYHFILGDPSMGFEDE